MTKQENRGKDIRLDSDIPNERKRHQSPSAEGFFHVAEESGYTRVFE